MFTVRMTIPDGRIRSILVGAFEGGSNYWMFFHKDRFDFGKYKKEDFQEGGQFYLPRYRFPGYSLPFVEGCAVLVCENDDEGNILETHRLDRQALQRGLDLMAEVRPSQLAEFLGENDDANTSDVFLQLCLLGEVRYG